MTHPHPDTLRLFDDPAYRAPDCDDVRAVFDLLPFTQDQLAAKVGAKSGRVVRSWMAPDTASKHDQIKFAPWRLMLIYAGLVPPPKPAIKSKKPLSPDKADRSKRPKMRSAVSD